MSDILEKFKKEQINDQEKCKFLERFADFIWNYLYEINEWFNEYGFREYSSNIIKSLTLAQFNNISPELKNWIYEKTVKFKSPSDWLDEFEYTNEEKYLKYLNISLAIFREITNFKYRIRGVYDQDIEVNLFEELSDDKTYNELQWFKKELSIFNLKFNDEFFLVDSIEHNELLKNINFDKLNNVVYRIKSSLSLETKEESMLMLAKNMLHVIEKKSKYRNVLDKFLNKNFLDNLGRECNGFFRHNIQDSGDKECTQKWIDFENQEKEEIINKTLTYYLSILAILRDENMIDDFIQSWT